MVLRRMKSMAAGADLSQALFDRFCEDMDANLREMGVGDVTVPKRMRAFGGGVLRPGRGLRSRLERGPRAAGAGPQQEYPERRAPRQGPSVGHLCRGSACRTSRLWTKRRCWADRGNSLCQHRQAFKPWTATDEQNRQHDRKTRSPGAFPSLWRRSRTPDCIATSRPTKRCERPSPRSAACAKFSPPVRRSTSPR